LKIRVKLKYTFISFNVTYLLKIESEFLYNETTKARVQEIIEKVYEGLRKNGECVFSVDLTNKIYLKLLEQPVHPEEVREYQVPVFIQKIENMATNNLDLTMRQIVSYIDGANYVKKISILADVKLELVKKCITELMILGWVTLIDIFQYSNVYTITKDIVNIIQDKNLQEKCIKAVAVNEEEPVHFKDIYALYCKLRPGLPLRHFCTQLKPRKYNINAIKFITFGCINGLIRRIHNYPICIDKPLEPIDQNLGNLLHYELLLLMDGKHCDDEICTKYSICYTKLEEIIAKYSCTVVSK